jgi:ElaB/YqjD/DUF883 family membrane-anchored ribosome-binding protein
MKLASARLRRTFRVAGAGAGLILFAACGGGDAAENDVAATPEEVDQDAPATVTEKELAAFTAPADSVLTPRQVEAYIKTGLLQFDLIRKEAPRLHQKAAEMEKRAKDGGALADLRNLAEGAGVMMQGADLIGGSFVRSARTLGYNPAEMEWVRDRMAEVSGYLIAKPMQAQAATMAQAMRQQAEAFRGQPGFSDAQIEEMIKNADEQLRAAQDESQLSAAARRNYEVLKSFRGNVSDPMWVGLGIAGGSGGLLGLSGLADPQDTAAQNKLTEYRRVFTDALANRVSPGMENAKPAAQNVADLELEGQNEN